MDVNLLVSVRHNPYKYRLSLHDGDISTISGFDSNVLADDIQMESEGGASSSGRPPKMGWTTVRIPEGAVCDPYCVLQLYDYYYFVSCAKISLGGLVGSSSHQSSPSPSPSLEDTNDSIPATASETTAIVQSPMIMSDLESEYTTPVIFQEEVIFRDIPAVRIMITASPDYLTYLALGISSEGGMIGSTAIVGSIVDSSSVDKIGGDIDSGSSTTTMITESGVYNVDNTTTQEYILGGKFIERVTPSPEYETLGLMSNFTIDYWEYGKMNHTLEVIIRKEVEGGSSSRRSICGKKIIWAHSSANIPSMTLAYHGTGTRGVHSSPVMCGDEDGFTSGSRPKDESDFDDEVAKSVNIDIEPPVMSPTKSPLIGDGVPSEPEGITGAPSVFQSSNSKSVRSIPFVAFALPMITLLFVYNSNIM